MASPLNSHRAWIVFGLALACAVRPNYYAIKHRDSA